MASKVDIINMALTRLGEQPIGAIDEGSEPANIAGRIYDIVLESELRKWPWTWATTTQELTSIASETPPDFATAFALPADYIKMVEITDPTMGTTYWRWNPHREVDVRFGNEWEIREKKLYINTDYVTIKYVKLQTDTTKWDSSFVDAFAWKLAMEMAMSLSEQPAMVDIARSQYYIEMNIARGNSGAETRRSSSVSTDWIRRRR